MLRQGDEGEDDVKFMCFYCVSLRLIRHIFIYYSQKIVNGDVKVNIILPDKVSIGNVCMSVRRYLTSLEYLLACDVY